MWELQTIDEIEARRKHDILSMTFYIEQELLRDLTAVLEVLPKHLEKQTEVMDQTLKRYIVQKFQESFDADPDSQQESERCFLRC